ncbi:hypothetical protein SAMN05444161_8457 [Rhizobiales bacterium GAS191]|nr:hypothetical protein SAMN05444161_8457 [Rhizobiales bacterium GAS191]
MKEPQKPVIRRRDLLLTVGAGVGLAVRSGVLPDQAAAAPVPINEKRKARYQANSAEVQNFYRVNRYPTQ